MNTLRVKSLGPDFKAPVRKHVSDAGADIHSAEELIIEPGKRHAISTQMAIAVPEGYYGRIGPRSGLAYKNGIDVLAGIIDKNYRGEVKVILINFGDSPFKVEVGDRIAQLIIEKIDTPEIKVVHSLDETERGEGGFGSTGIN